MSLFFLILGIILARLFWRQLVTVLAWAVAIAACYALLRAAPALGVSSGWLSTMYGGVILGIVGGVLLGWRIVVNWLVNADRAREHERVDSNQDKRLV